MAVRIGVGLDDWPFGERAPSLLCDYVDAAEGLGIDSIWLTDRVTGPSFNMEAIVALSFIAARTSRMKFGTSVLALPVRHPTILAKELATLDYLSGGRSLPAVGIGSDDRHVYEACGVSRSERAGRTDEMIEIMRLLWSEDNVSFSGRYYTLSGVTVEPKPIQKDLPPIWIGGRTEPAMRRVARLGDGWLVSQATPDEVLLGIDRINQLAAEYGRTIDDDHFGVLFSFCLAGSRAEAETLAAPYVTRHRQDAHPQDLAAVGTAQDLADLIDRYVAAGATRFVVRPVCPPEQMTEQLEILGREVVPAYHRAAERVTG